MTIGENIIQQQNIVFYDGVCALCNRSVKRVIKWDKRQHIRYAPLQGATAKRLLSVSSVKKLDSIIFYSQGKTFEKSAAFFEIIKQIGGWQKVLLVLSIFPESWANWIYDIIAKNRYRWFGKYDSCPIPAPKIRELFLE